MFKKREREREREWERKKKKENSKLGLIEYIHDISKTCLYNIDPFKPHFYIVKLGLQGYTLFFLCLFRNIHCGYIEAVLTSTHNPYFEQKYEKYQSSSSENFHFFEVKFSIYLKMRVFVMRNNEKTNAEFPMPSVRFEPNHTIVPKI